MKDKSSAPQEKESMIFTGEEHEVTLPSGKVVTIRESNGEDDAILSRVKNAMDDTHVYNYLASIITMDHSTKAKPVAADLLEWLVNDKNYLLFKQRIINLGPELELIHTCEDTDCKSKNHYSEDLSEMDGDLGQKNYTPNEKQVYKYPSGEKRVIEFTSTKNHQFKFELLTGLIQRANADVPESKRDINQILTGRNLKVFENNKWLDLFDFRRFSSKEMNEIRKYVLDQDKPFEPMVSFECPKCQRPYQQNLFFIPVFFYPGVQI